MVSLNANDIRMGRVADAAKRSYYDSLDELTRPGSGLDISAWEGENSVANHVAKLRKKIEDNEKQPKFILTRWGFGYSFCPSAS